MSRIALGYTALLALALPTAHAAYSRHEVPASWPDAYPGKPSGDLSPDWQRYYEITTPLPNVTFDVPRSFAGNVPVGRENHPNNTLFFWAVEKENGSLTVGADEHSDKPWAVWLNGGPGASSLIGFATENGPFRVNPDSSVEKNNYSWSNLADYFWVDQPVGVGFATAESDGYAHDEDAVGNDFMGFLANLVKVFPSLAKRPLHLTGESYAGVYIPYIMKAYFSTPNPPVKIAKFAIGNGAIPSGLVFSVLPTLTVIETYPQLIGYDPEVYDYFREQEHRCGYDLNLTYPQQGGHFPTLNHIHPTLRSGHARRDELSARSRSDETSARLRALIHSIERGELGRRDDGAPAVKRDLSLRANGTVDPWYGCFLMDELVDYAVNYSQPWSVAHSRGKGFYPFDVSDALVSEVKPNPHTFLNDNQTRAAVHAPSSRQWAFRRPYPFLGDPQSDFNDPSELWPMAFLSELATNASAHGVSVVLYSGNGDSSSAHRGTEIVIQNTTFGGIQGFTRRPSTPWFDDNGERGGIVHQERNWTYVLVEDAGHLVPQMNPARGYVLAREFIFGTNQTGLVTDSGGSTTVVGGEVGSLAAPAIPAPPGIAVGSATTESTYTYPSRTIAAWESFLASATAGDVAVTGAAASPVAGQGAGNGAGRASGVRRAVWLSAVVVAALMAVGV
ncbi:Alpha/Beta hydrolase protein [Trametes elegans]|nr:Alpha/Beta hydrolase protein [Trametes elegans]